MQKVHLLLFDQRKLCAAIERSEEEEEGRRAMMMMAFAAPIYSLCTRSRGARYGADILLCWEEGLGFIKLQLSTCNNIFVRTGSKRISLEENKVNKQWQFW